MLKLRKIACIMAALCAGIALMGSMALAANNNDMKVGVVDLERVYKNAPRIKQFEDEVAALNQLLTAKLDIRSQNMMLNEAEINELVDLKTKPNPSTADTARITQLLNLERGKDDELKKLQSTANLNDQQKARLKELQDIQQKSKTTGAALYNDYDAQLQDKAQDIHTKEDAEMRTAVSKVAEAKGLTLVFDKATVLFGGIDLTDDVIGKLDRAMK